MKRLKEKAVIVLLGMLGMVLSSQGQTDIAPTATPKERQGRVITPERPKGNLDTPTTTSIRPPRPERNEVTPQVREKLNIFRREADEYLRQQEDLRKRLLGATSDAERVIIRDRLQTLYERWLERARLQREDLQERQKELREKFPTRPIFRESAREKMEAAKDQIRERPKTRE